MEKICTVCRETKDVGLFKKERRVCKVCAQRANNEQRKRRHAQVRADKAERLIVNCAEMDIFDVAGSMAKELAAVAPASYALKLYKHYWVA